MLKHKCWQTSLDLLLGNMVARHKQKNNGKVNPKFARTLACRLGNWATKLKLAADRDELLYPEMSSKVLVPIEIQEQVKSMAEDGLSERKIHEKYPSISIRQIKKILCRRLS